MTARPSLIQNSKFNDFLWVCWFLSKNLFNFVPPARKLHNPYCHNLQRVFQHDLCHLKRFYGYWFFFEKEILYVYWTFDFAIKIAFRDWDNFCKSCPHPEKLLPCPFIGPKMFCAGPKLFSQPKYLTAFSASSKLFCQHKNQFYWMQIIFLSGTKNLDQPKTF